MRSTLKTEIKIGRKYKLIKIWNKDQLYVEPDFFGIDHSVGRTVYPFCEPIELVALTLRPMFSTAFPF